uniref:Uncharacterized protein n=1 Tax=Junco hyemalis TaxID=40217 RepID=A0A8C5IKG4_JUNHY
GPSTPSTPSPARWHGGTGPRHRAPNRPDTPRYRHRHGPIRAPGPPRSFQRDGEERPARLRGCSERLPGSAEGRGWEEGFTKLRLRRLQGGVVSVRAWLDALFRRLWRRGLKGAKGELGA